MSTTVVPGLVVDFCGELVRVAPDRPFVLGRKGDLVLDDRNAHLHRRFLQLETRAGVWWLSNVGRLLAASVSDEEARFEARLAPGAELPLTLARSWVRFRAGATDYEVGLHLQSAPPPVVPHQPQEGLPTAGPGALNLEQLQLVLALAEPTLRRGREGAITLPTNAAAAARLGWPLTKFNRKLDHICEALTRSGVRGLHGGADRLATSRRARLVEYALAARLVVRDDLTLLD